jgi:hypothetical protein
LNVLLGSSRTVDVVDGADVVLEGWIETGEKGAKEGFASGEGFELIGVGFVL